MQVLSRDEVIQLYMYFVMNPSFSKVLVEKEDDYFNFKQFSMVSEDCNK